MLTLFHDYTSPASAVAVARLQRLADEGLAVEFAGFEAIGVDATLPVTVDVVSALADLTDAAATEGVVLRRPPALPPTAWAHVLGEEAERQDLGASWRQICYAAFWQDGADLGDHRVLALLGTAAGMAHPSVSQVLSDHARLAAVRRRAGQHRRAGVGGVPTILAQRTLIPALLPDEELRAIAQL